MCTKPSTKRRYRLRNWRDYNAALVRRGSLTLWLAPEALASWCGGGRTGRRGRPPIYSDVAITCILTLQAVYHLPLRATKGLVQSVMQLARLALPVPDPSTLARRRLTLPVALPVRAVDGPLHWVVDATGLKVYGEGEWKVRQHGYTKRRTWLKVHLAVDEATSELRAVGVSTNNVSDGEMLPELLATEQARLAQVTGDGLFDEWRCWNAVRARPEHPRAVFPPPRPRTGRQRPLIKQHGNSRQPPLDRDVHVRRLRRVGRRRWKAEVNYHRRSLCETAMFRFKHIFGERVSCRTVAGQMVEVCLRARALNLMTFLGMPAS